MGRLGDDMCGVCGVGFVENWRVLEVLVVVTYDEIEIRFGGKLRYAFASIRLSTKNYATLPVGP